MKLVFSGNLIVFFFFLYFSRAVHSTRFSLDGLRVVSASDDCSVRLWDLSEESEIFEVKEHKVLLNAHLLGCAALEIDY